MRCGEYDKGWWISDSIFLFFSFGVVVFFFARSTDDSSNHKTCSSDIYKTITTPIPCHHINPVGFCPPSSVGDLSIHNTVVYLWALLQ
jgi:hypothetical protein